MELFRVIHPVADIETATYFYSHVLGVRGERVSPGRHYFQCGGTILACYEPFADGDPIGQGWRHHSNQYLYFAVSDLERALILVREAGGQIEAEIESMPWGERMFYAKDPFENPISFVDRETVFRGSHTRGRTKGADRN
jgi:predicted enzyme related to lactoylglutathione lyase